MMMLYLQTPHFIVFCNGYDSHIVVVFGQVLIATLYSATIEYYYLHRTPHAMSFMTYSFKQKRY